jgi:GDPmannose 4,6-dehydratase
MAFESASIHVGFEGDGVDEVVREVSTGRVVAQVNPEYFRPSEVDLLLGDATKAKRVLGWEAKTSVADLCQSMVEADLERRKSGFGN